MYKVVELLKKANKTIASMESCTGGGFVNEVTNVEGASEVIKFSAVTYSNEYKIKFGVSEYLIDKYSVYSIEVAREMSKKISEFAKSSIGIGISGTLKRYDENNITKDNDLVYYSIYDKDNDKYYSDVIKLKSVGRENNKKEIIHVIVDKLKEILE